MTLCRTAAPGLLVTIVATSLAHADVEPNAGMLRFPDISAEHIVFAYANDLWIVDRDGGLASPLASPPGSERAPRFSADGKTIAFEGNYDGGRDLYTIGIDGSDPTRLTHHPSNESLCDWTPDGGLLFFTSGQSGLGRMPKLFTLDASGGLPAALPVPYGAVGAISDDGTWLAYTPHTRDNRTWKRYRGGMATDIWLFNLETNESERITDWEGTDSQPMWRENFVYYLSDQGDEHRLNIWRYNVRNGRRRQMTDFEDYDVKWPAIGPGPRGRGEIVLQNGAGLHVLDLQNGRTREIEVAIPGARPTLRPRRVDARQYITSFGLSSTGKRAVVAARGDVWTAPAEHGSPRNLTRTSGVNERMPTWSPSGQWIAYFSDATGEYELYVTQSDGKGETRQLTEGSETFYFNLWWSPDSKQIAFTDKAGGLHLHSIADGTTKKVDQDPWASQMSVSWSHDSRWITYARNDDDKPAAAVWVYDVENDEHHQVTAGMFGDASPVFDRKGEYLFFSSSRSFSPRYSSIDLSFIYDDSQVLIAVPLCRADHELPWLLESDEETWDDEDEDEDTDEEDEDDESDEDSDEDSDGDEDEDEAEDDEDAAPTSPIHGTWEGTLTGLASVGMPPEMDTVDITMSIVVADDGSITGSSSVMGESTEFDDITFDETSGEFTATRSDDESGVESTLEATLKDGQLTGTWEVAGAVSGSGTWQATKVSSEADDDASADEPVETVEIDLDGFERRAILLPVARGAFGQLAVNDKNQLIYVRTSGGSAGIKLFDMKKKEDGEKTVGSGMVFDISADGKKIILPRGTNGAAIQNAAAGASAKPVVSSGMTVMVEPREEWRQIVREAWRLYRDFFYVSNLHGVDWDEVWERHVAMLPDCVTREDVSFVIREMIAELNVGHAYYFGGDGESQPRTPVGMLGVDWGMSDGAYRIDRIIEAGAWDVDARGPLTTSGLDVKEGDYVLAVNGVPMDTTKDPWAAFIGLVGREITLTVSANPELDDEARDVVVRPVATESGLRYRAWIEHNRKYVADRTDGRVGYVYVPDTGVNGQNNLIRQFYGQIDKPALIVDERWNGGGQIPTRFIEILNRPVTNYWAQRDGRDTSWPPDAHQGAKCMLINGLAGSGGDMFPWLFRQNELGKLIGTRTWGGLVGISGNPGLIDGGYVAVPTFGFYETDGTWGIEGHGVDPDIEVVDDPALMVDGGDPQLDRAIAEMLESIERDPMVRPDRPEDPDRSGMGLPESDR